MLFYLTMYWHRQSLRKKVCICCFQESQDPSRQDKADICYGCLILSLSALLVSCSMHLLGDGVCVLPHWLIETHTLHSALSWLLNSHSEQGQYRFTVTATPKRCHVIGAVTDGHPQVPRRASDSTHLHAHRHTHLLLGSYCIVIMTCVWLLQ